jgi:single-stranded DNA-binding protein
MTLFENTVTLRGFLGSDAEVPSSDGIRSDSFAVLTVCIATGTWKKQTSEWVSRTERHRVFCMGPYFCGFTRGMKRGDYVEIDGELHASESGSAVHALSIRRLECPPAGVDEGEED